MSKVSTIVEIFDTSTLRFYKSGLRPTMIGNKAFGAGVVSRAVGYASELIREKLL